jgi:hypothetical protein
MKWLCSNDKLTVADFWIGTLYTDHCVNKNNVNKTTLAVWADVLKMYPNFKRFGEDFAKENADWLKKRNARPM